MLETPMVMMRWGLGLLSDTEALSALCANHIRGCGSAFVRIAEIVAYMATTEAEGERNVRTIEPMRVH